jgi:hypothetical protein
MRSGGTDARALAPVELHPRPGLGIHGWNARRCPACQDFFTAAIARRVVRSPPTKPIAVIRRCTTSARIRPPERATSSSILSIKLSIGRDRCARSSGLRPSARNFTYRATVWWSHRASSAAAR